MLDPLIICIDDYLIVADKSYFDGIGNLMENERRLEVNVNSKGTANYKWILDFNGNFYVLKKIGESKFGFFEKIGISRQRYFFEIFQERKISIGELKLIIKDLHDPNEDFPNVFDLKEQLQNMDENHLINNNDLKLYHHEQ